MNKLIFLVGLPGCGKSTYSNEELAKDCEILSSDSLRKELFNDITNQSNNALVFKTLFKRARQLLQDNKNVVIDATNVNIDERAKALEEFKDLNVYKVAIVFDVPVSVCIDRDAKRERSVGVNVIKKFAKIFTKPTKDEGFDEIIVIK